MGVASGDDMRYGLTTSCGEGWSEVGKEESSFVA